MITGSSKAQLTPIFSIYEKDVIEAFKAQLKGEVQDYMTLLKLKTKFPSSNFASGPPNPESFDWIEDMSLLQQLPEELTLLRVTLDEEL